MSNPELPLVELHRHLDGNIRPQTIWDLAQKHNISLPADDFASFKPMTQIQGQSKDLMDFLTKLDFGVSVLADLDACHRVAMENIEDARQSGLDYVELRFSPYYMARSFGLPIEGVVEAVIAGVEEGSRVYGVSANLIGILSRSFGLEACRHELAGLLAHKSHIVALDLAGDELGYPAPLFEAEFKQARDAGWQVTVHAGEADGPQSIWDAINLLGATRIGHGVAAAQDPKLMAYMRENNIAIETCLTSNLQTNTVQDLLKHPLPEFLRQDLLVSLSTDDPAVSDIKLQHEYTLARELFDFDQATMDKLQINAVKAAFLSDEEKQNLLARKSLQ